jgi:hypothetical protein
MKKYFAIHYTGGTFWHCEAENVEDAILAFQNRVDRNSTYPLEIYEQVDVDFRYLGIMHKKWVLEPYKGR